MQKTFTGVGRNNYRLSYFIIIFFLNKLILYKLKNEDNRLNIYFREFFDFLKK